jgi:hypothetical protein
MTLTYYERKACLPHGAVKHVADLLRTRRGSCANSTVSETLQCGGDREIEMELARLMRDPITNARVTVHEAFGPPARKLHRKGAHTAEVA